MDEEICIIGGGAAGIISCKIAKDYGLVPFVIEKSNWFGGIWKNSDEEIGVWNNLRTNTSKYFTCFSDMPWPSSTDPTPPNREVMDYFLSYIRHHSLFDNFHFNCKAIYVNKTQEGYFVRWQHTLSGEIFEKVFPYVIVANGFHTKEIIPVDNSCQSKLKNLHSGKYRDPKDFIGQKVIIVGASTSSCDIAGDLVNYASEVIQVIRKPHYLLPKYYHGIPIDFFSKTKSLHNWIISKNLEIGPEMKKGFCRLAANPGHPDLVILPEWEQSNSFSIVSINYKKCLEDGKIQIIKGKPTNLTENSLILESGNELEADAVIWCTGYEADLSFCDEKILEILNYDGHDNVLPVVSFLNTIHPDLYGFGIIGMLRGVFIGTYELQVELFIRHIKNLTNLTEQTLRAGVEHELRLRRAIPKPQYIYYSLEFTERLMNVLNFKSFESNSDTQDIIKFRDILYLPQFYRLDKGESQFILCKQVIDELKERFEIHEETLTDLFFLNR